MLSSLDRWLAPAPEAERVGWVRQWTYAHRGLHRTGVLENSPSAFAAAVEAGFGIECDVHRSLDGRAIVFHDWDLDRLTAKTGPVAALTAAELAAIPLRSRESIPTLRVTLDAVAGKVPVLIELKSRRDLPPSPLCRAVLRDLEGYGGRCAVMSFDPRIARWFATHGPAVVRGLVVTEANARTLGAAIKRHLALWRARPDFLAYDVRDLPSRFAAAQRARGLPLLTWTVSTKALRDKAKAHADAPIVEAEGLALDSDRS